MNKALFPSVVSIKTVVVGFTEQEQGVIIYILQYVTLAVQPGQGITGKKKTSSIYNILQ